jgi:signal transduction histidine kinase
MPRLDERWPAAFFVLIWLVAAAALMAASGGTISPLSVALAVAPAWVLALGKPWLREAGAGAVIGYALVALFAPHTQSPQLGPLPELLGVLALAFGVVLMTIAQPQGAASDSIVGERIAEVSHELRTPLTHILGFSEMIERQIFGPVGERYVEYAGLIRKSGNHLLGLVNDLLDLSRLEAGRYELELETFDVRAVVEEVVRLSTDVADKKSITLGMMTPERPLNVRADERALRRILINTLGNGVKFTPDGGRVIVAARAESAALVLETIDNGPGIPEAERARLGTAYERGSVGGRAEGTGLGLALVRALAGLHGGSLSFHDAPGGGALVRVTLPVLAEA